MSSCQIVASGLGFRGFESREIRDAQHPAALKQHDPQIKAAGRQARGLPRHQQGDRFVPGAHAFRGPNCEARIRPQSQSAQA